MATAATWKKLRYFKKNSKTDSWGDTKAIDDNHLLKLDDFRDYLGIPIIVTHAVKTDGHASKSYHYPENGACATDIIIPDYVLSPFDLVMDATRFGFTGIGFYPHWRYKGVACGGLHLDSRPLKWDIDSTVNYCHSRWMGVRDETGKQRYIELSFENMVKYTNFESDRSINDLH